MAYPFISLHNIKKKRREKRNRHWRRLSSRYAAKNGYERSVVYVVRHDVFVSTVEITLSTSMNVWHLYLSCTFVAVAILFDCVYILLNVIILYLCIRLGIQNVYRIKYVCEDGTSKAYGVRIGMNEWIRDAEVSINLIDEYSKKRINMNVPHYIDKRSGQ